LSYLKQYITAVLILFLFLACHPVVMKNQLSTEGQEFPTSLPDSIWVAESFQDSLDSILAYYNQANKKLSQGDTIGAEIYFDEAFGVLANLSDEDRSSLQYWADYDSVFKEMNHKYEQIYLETQEPLEAEEVLEDITDLEEATFPDSILFGDGTVVDTSGDLPLTLNRKVRLAIHYFETRGRYVFTKWLQRSGRYESLVKEILREKGLPEDLAYLAMIESGFNPRARSYARAVGMWQFISATGRHYGLRHNWWFDERRDVIKATRAAASHLSDLYQRFGDWYLSLAGYNCNPRKVERNVRRYRTKDFWKLKRLPRQTRNYIPTYLAALIISKSPEKFGFFVDKLTPLKVDTVLISESVDLNVIAQLVDTTYRYIKEINPAVLRWVTPPGVKNFTLYLPQGTKEKFKAGYKKIPNEKKRSWVRHRIRSGETLSTIAQKYHTSMSVLRSTNKLHSNRIRAGKYLLIPVPQNKRAYYAEAPVTSRRRRHYSYRKITHVPGHKKIIYKVKPGDTLGEIAELYHTRANKIRLWNGLRYGQYIRPKQNLVLWIPKDGLEFPTRTNKKTVNREEPGKYYIVQIGDTLWDIAKKYGISIRKIKRLNRKRSARIRPGERLRVSEN